MCTPLTHSAASTPLCSALLTQSTIDNSTHTPCSGAIEYKYVVRPSGGKKALAWQPCNNLALKLDESAPLPELTVRDAWEGSLHELLPGMASLPEPPKAAVPEPAAAAAEHDGGASVVDKDGAADAAVDVSAAAATPVTTMGEEAAPLAAPLAEDAPPAVASAARAAPAANSNGRRRRTTSAVLTAAEDDAAAAAPVPKQKPVMRQNVLPDWLTGKKVLLAAVECRVRVYASMSSCLSLLHPPRPPPVSMCFLTHKCLNNPHAPV